MLTNKGFKIKKNGAKPELLKDLTVQPFVSEGFYAPHFKVYRENTTRYRVPRFYGQEHYDFKYDASIHNIMKINIPFCGTLKKENKQFEASDAVIDQLHNLGGGILCLPTGYGKTTTALHIISKIGMKTLIIVHKEFLMNQWIDRIKFFLPSARIGIIRQNKVDVANKDIVIGMLQSLSVKSYEDSVFQGFGFTVIDETHHICTKTFSCALFNICTKYILGLSATPDRKDGLTKVLHWFIGPIAFKVERDTSQMSITADIHHFTCKEFKTIDVPLSTTGNVSVPEIINIITQITSRNQLICDKLVEFHSIGRKTIFLSDRRQHCIDIQNMLSQMGITDVGLYMGGMKKQDLDASEQKMIILATYSLAHEGLDIPTLDTLILATPKTDVIQACGRILRTGNARKHDPYILDIVDEYSVLPRQFQKRSTYYRKSNFNIKSNKDTKKDKTKDNKLKGFAFIEDNDDNP